MRIKNEILTSVSESEIIKGVYRNDEVTELADNCLSELPSLKKAILPKVKKIGNNCLSYNDKLTEAKIRKQELKVKNIDGYCFVIESKRISKGIHIFSGWNFVDMTDKKIRKEVCFVASKDKFNAHGKTIKQAVSDLQFKIVAEKLMKEPIKKDTKFTVKYYRLLTGACDFGCRSWMEQNKIPFDIVGNETIEKKPMIASELLPILEKTNAYGIDKIKKLLTF